MSVCNDVIFVASFPGLPRFRSSVCILERALPLPCIVLNANENGGGLGTRLSFLADQSHSAPI